MKCIAAFMFILILLLCCGSAYAAPLVEDNVQNQIDSLDSTNWDDFINDLKADYNGIYVPKNLKDSINTFLSGRQDESPFNIILALIWRELPMALGLLAKVAALAIGCGLLENMRANFASEGIANIARFACYAIAAAVLLQSFFILMNDGRKAIDRMSGFLQIAMPIMAVYLTATGAPSSAALVQPAAAAITGLVGTIIKAAVLPLIFASAAASVINGLTDKIKIDKFAQTARTAAHWLLGITFTVFAGTMIIRGASAAVADGVALRTAKYAAGGMLPVIGGMAGDAAEVLLGGSLLIKNAVGTAGMATIALICAAPCIRIAVVIFAVRACAALLQPVTQGELCTTLSHVGDSMTSLFAAVVGVGLMTFLAVGLLSGIGSAAVMLR